jgi:hypothetical protein
LFHPVPRLAAVVAVLVIRRIKKQQNFYVQFYLPGSLSRPAASSECRQILGSEQKLDCQYLDSLAGAALASLIRGRNEYYQWWSCLVTAVLGIACIVD